MIMAPEQLIEECRAPATLKFDPSESWGGYIEVDREDFERWEIAGTTKAHQQTIRDLITQLSHLFVPELYHSRIEYIEKGFDSMGLEMSWSYGWKYVPGVKAQNYQGDGPKCDPGRIGV